MARHLSFRSGNPALNKNTFKGMTGQRSSGPIIRDDFMTIEGTVNKTAISLFLIDRCGILFIHININIFVDGRCILWNHSFFCDNI